MVKIKVKFRSSTVEGKLGSISYYLSHQIEKTTQIYLNSIENSRIDVSIVVNLYTVKLLWEVLGVDNYGIYNLVGGIFFMFAFLNTAMVASSQRFISFELGRGNKENLRKTFSISLVVHILLAGCVLILAETIGLWFLNEKLNIPEGSTLDLTKFVFLLPLSYLCKK